MLSKECKRGNKGASRAVAMKAAKHLAAVVAVGCALCIGGCAGLHEDKEGLSALPAPSDQRPSDEGVMQGQRHFVAGDYGLAERNFRTAVEVNPVSGPAWLGLAASYDRLSRFDLAERAYEHAMKLDGRTPTLLNNMGYHYMLRGRFGAAKSTLQEAARLDPDNAFIQGNLVLLANWKTGERHPDDIPRRR